jgi:hypothetical protein
MVWMMIPKSAWIQSFKRRRGKSLFLRCVEDLQTNNDSNIQSKDYYSCRHQGCAMCSGELKGEVYRKHHQCAMDNEVDSLSDMEGNNAMDKDAYLTEMDDSCKDKDVKMSEDSNSTSFVSFHGPV